MRNILTAMAIIYATFFAASPSWAFTLPNAEEVEIVQQGGKVFACEIGTLNIEGDQVAGHNPGGSVAVFRGSDNISISRTCIDLGIDMHSSQGARKLFTRDIKPIIQTAIDGGCKLPNIFVGREAAYQSGGAASQQLSHTEGGRNIAIRHSCANIAVKIREPVGVPAGAILTRDGFLVPDGRDYRRRQEYIPHGGYREEWVEVTETYYESGYGHSGHRDPEHGHGHRHGSGHHSH